jgi:hypothetical protein
LARLCRRALLDLMGFAAAIWSKACSSYAWSAISRSTCPGRPSATKIDVISQPNRQSPSKVEGTVEDRRPRLASASTTPRKDPCPSGRGKGPAGPASRSDLAGGRLDRP